MMGDYGCDDMEWLILNSGRPDAVKIDTRGRTYYLPVARFDNRVDKTTFVRAETSSWSKENVRALHDGLAESFSIGYVSSTFEAAIVFVILIAVLIVRPSGILGRAAVQKV